MAQTLHVKETMSKLPFLPGVLSGHKSSLLTTAMCDTFVGFVSSLMYYGELPVFSSRKANNPIARRVLVKQLQRLQLTVIATGNGEEALAEWEARGPGYFSAALFDHHMPVCDGAEATKRLRHMENERNCTAFLPGKPRFYLPVHVAAESFAKLWL
ncbi:hypothetical protein H0H87_000191 [Tephrocybe sp. NHM501043]|nr:hypothetical protein H0H87_000191 [Tephrocybe sp. NHM501043]